GQIMLTNANNNIDGYYCDGPGADQNVVPGRLGFTQGSVPYADAYPKTAGMDGRCETSHSTGGCVDNSTGDGADHCTLNGYTWQAPITVWRGITSQAEDGEGGEFMANGSACTPGTSGCAWSKGGGGFNASQCNTPGANGCAIIIDAKNGMGKRIGYIGPAKGI